MHWDRHNICYSRVNCALGPSKCICYSGDFVIAGFVIAGFVIAGFVSTFKGVYDDYRQQRQKEMTEASALVGLLLAMALTG